MSNEYSDKAVESLMDALEEGSISIEELHFVLAVHSGDVAKVKAAI